MERRREKKGRVTPHEERPGETLELNAFVGEEKKRKEKAVTDPGRERLFQWPLCDFPRDEQDSRSRRYASPQFFVLTGPRYGGEDWGTPMGPC